MSPFWLCKAVVLLIVFSPISCRKTLPGNGAEVQKISRTGVKGSSVAPHGQETHNQKKCQRCQKLAPVSLPALPLPRAKASAGPGAHKMLFCELKAGLSHMESTATSCAGTAALLGYPLVPPLPRLHNAVDRPPLSERPQPDPFALTLDVDHFFRQFSALWDIHEWEAYARRVGARVVPSPGHKQLMQVDRSLELDPYEPRLQWCVTTYLGNGSAPAKRCGSVAKTEPSVRALLRWAARGVSVIHVLDPRFNFYFDGMGSRAGDWSRAPNMDLTAQANRMLRSLGSRFDCLHARVEASWANTCCGTWTHLRACARVFPSCYKDAPAIAKWLQTRARPPLQRNRTLFVCSGADRSHLAPLPQVTTLPHTPSPQPLQPATLSCLLTYHVRFCTSCKFALPVSLEQLKAGLACKLNIALHVVSGYFSAW